MEYSKNIVHLKMIRLLFLLVPIPVGTAYCEDDSIIVTLDLLQQVTLACKEDGFIKSSKAKPGNSVSANETVIQIDPTELKFELEKARADLEALQVSATDNSEIDGARAKRTGALEYIEGLERIAPLTRLPRLEIVRAQSEFDESDAALVGAMNKRQKARLEFNAKGAEVRLLSYRLNNMTLASPFAGRIAEAFKFEGDFVTKGEEIAVIYRLDQLAGVALISRNLFRPAEIIGKSIAVTWDGGTQSSTIERVQPRVDAADMYSVYFEIENVRDQNTGQWWLLPGMTITGKLKSGDLVQTDR